MSKFTTLCVGALLVGAFTLNLIVAGRIIHDLHVELSDARAHASIMQELNKSDEQSRRTRYVMFVQSLQIQGLTEQCKELQEAGVALLRENIRLNRELERGSQPASPDHIEPPSSRET